MSNSTTKYPSALSWLRLPRWWSLAKKSTQLVQPVATQTDIAAQHLAFHRAYQRFAQTQPAWVARGFDADFLRQVMDVAELPSGQALAAAWDRQFGPLSPMPVRCQQMAELAVVANAFLSLYQAETLQTAKNVA